MTSWRFGSIPAAADAGGGGAVLVAIKVTPTPAFIRGAGTRQFTAIGSYNDGSTADVTTSATWASSSTAIATVGAGTGLATGVARGTVTITATIGAIVGPATLTVTAGFVSVGNYQLVAAIEGWPYLMTDGDPAAVAAAWGGTDWTQALGGMALEGMIEQTIDPYDPSPAGGEGGTLYLSFVPDEDDLLGIATHRTDAGGESPLTATVDVTTTAIGVASTSSFPAAPCELCCGTETFSVTSYSGGNTINVDQRGLYSPFGRNGDPHFARHHRLADFGFLGPELRPVVTEHPRVWIGRQIGIWEHVKTNGVLDPVASAKRLFAGIIVGVRDVNGLTVLTLQALRDTVNDTVLLRDQFSGQVREGLFLNREDRFELTESLETASVPVVNNANPLRVLASGAAAADEANEGWYPLTDLYTILNNWLIAEKIAGRIDGTYSFSLSTVVDGSANAESGYRTRLGVLIPTGASGFHGHYTLEGTTTAGGGAFIAWSFMGFDADSELAGEVEGDEDTARYSENAPVRWTLTQNVFGQTTIELETSEGNWQAQTKKLPAEARNVVLPIDPTLIGDWGLFLFDNRVVFLAQRLLLTDPTGKTFSLRAMTTLGDPFTGADALKFVRRYGEEPIRLTQIFILEDNFAPLVASILCSTGVTGYNDGTATYDVLPYGLGCAVPETLLEGGTAESFYERLRALPFGDQPMRVKIDKPARLADLLSGDFLVRIAHLVWKIGVPGGGFTAGVLKIARWTTPTLATAAVNLTEANKAAPADVEDDQRTTSDLTSKFAKNVAKFEFARTFDGRYTDRITVLDPVSIDANGAAPITIPTRNMDRATIEAALAFFVPWFPTVSRPLRIVRRTIGLDLFYTCNVLDPAVVDDDEVRDPTTGRRGTTRPGIILRHAIALGGWTPGTDDVAAPLGEVDVALLPVDRTVPWSPAAAVDETANAGGFSAGYNAGTKTLRLKLHAYSQAPEPADVAHFAHGYAIEVNQLDPDNPGSVLAWTDTINGAPVGNDIVLLGGLTVPAWDATKTYYVRPRAWPSATAAQRLRAFEADDADFLIANSRAPFEYGSADNTLGIAASHTDRPERYATMADGDGVALDVANEHGAATLANNLIDHRTAGCSPSMDNLVRAGGGGSARTLVSCRRVHLNPQILTGTLARTLYVRGWFRSKTGAASTLYVTLSRTRPSETPGESTHVNVTFPAGSVLASWNTTSTVSWTTAVLVELPTSPIDEDGNVWVSVETSGDAETRGYPTLRMRERT